MWIVIREYQVRIVEQDVVALTDEIAKLRPLRKSRLWTLVLLGIVMGPLAIWTYWIGLTGLAVFCVLFACAYAALLTPLTRMVRQRGVRALLRSSKNAVVLGDRTLRISSESLEQSSDFGYTGVYWNAVDRLYVNDEYAFVFISAVDAFIVPRRELSAEEFDEFVRLTSSSMEDKTDEISSTMGL